MVEQRVTPGAELNTISVLLGEAPEFWGRSARLGGCFERGAVSSDNEVGFVAQRREVGDQATFSFSLLKGEAQIAVARQTGDVGGRPAGRLRGFEGLGDRGGFVVRALGDAVGARFVVGAAKFALLLLGEFLRKPFFDSEPFLRRFAEGGERALARILDGVARWFRRVEVFGVKLEPRTNRARVAGLSRRPARGGV
jgi:hypothetical protein